MPFIFCINFQATLPNCLENCIEISIGLQWIHRLFWVDRTLKQADIQRFTYSIISSVYFVPVPVLKLYRNFMIWAWFILLPSLLYIPIWFSAPQPSETSFLWANAPDSLLCPAFCKCSSLCMAHSSLPFRLTPPCFEANSLRSLPCPL